MTDETNKFFQYWENIFADGEEINKEGFFISLPTDSYGKKEYSMDLDICERMLKISAGNNSALYVMLISGVAYLLGRYTNSRKVFLGTANFLNSDGMQANKVLPVAFEIDEEKTIKEWVDYVKKNLLEVQKHADGSIAEYMDKRGLVYQQFINTAVSLEMAGRFNTKLAEATEGDSFAFKAENNQIKLEVNYIKSWEKETNLLIKNLMLYYNAFSGDLNRKLKDIEVIDTNEINYIENLNATDRNYSFEKGYYELFKAQCDKAPENIAIVENGESITYRQLDLRASQMAGYFTDKANIKPKDFVAILYPNSTQQVVITMAVVKSGAAYVPLDVDLPKERIKFIVNDSGAKVIVFPKNKIKLAQDLLWECHNVERILCADSFNAENEAEEEINAYMDKSLWEYVGDTADDDISLGGWSSSYTGINFSAEEMEEYSQNAFKKLSPLLTGKEKILEIGCGSGLTMFPLSKYADQYYATDLSQSTVNKDRQKAESEGYNNIHLDCFAAHDIKKVNQQKFDLAVMNSVIQCFNGHNYLKNVIRDLISMMNDEGIIFIGDIMDLDKKAEFEKSLKDYKKANPQANTKTDLSEELFLGRTFFDNLPYLVDGIESVELTPKIYTIPNELTLYRYDAIIKVNKKTVNKTGQTKFLDCLKDLEPYEGYSEKIPQASALNDPAIIVYTSGTTGTPKGVILSYKSLLNLCFYSEEVFGITEKDKRAKHAAFSFDAAIWETFPFFLKGASVYIIDPNIKLDLKAVNDFIEENEITIVLFTTQVAEQFMKLKNKCLRFLIAGGEKLRRFYDNGNYKMMNVYGPTETTVVATNYIVEQESEDIPIGKPFPNVRCYIVDLMGRKQPIGARGEIYIAGLGVGLGYVNLPELTKERFSCYNGERVYKTGDYAYYRSDGNIMFFGRRDKQVKINGFRIEAGEIEKHMLAMDRIKEAVVLDFSDADGNKFLCCYYAAAKELDVDELTEKLSESLPFYMIPAYFVRLDKIPYTINGKLIRKGLPDPRQALGGEKAKPTNKKEAEILEIWKNVLGVKNIGIDDDFFKIGGNSLKGIKVVSAMSENFKVDINKIFNYTTIKALAENVDYVQGYFNKVKAEVIKDQTSGISEQDKKLNKENYIKYTADVNSLEKHDKLNKKYSNILLLGATGFLGSHILYYLAKNTDTKITAVIRDSSKAENKLMSIMKYYFGEEAEEILSNVDIVYGEITKEGFGIDKEIYEGLCKNTDTVINAAANVHHYGDYASFYDINAGVCQRLVDFALEGKRKDIHHVSTVGIAAGVVEGRKDMIFTENDIDVKQDIDNVYAKTKFLGEKILLAAREKNLNISIYRMGNLTGRRKDGFFQKNMEENGFYKILRAMISMGIIPDIKEKTIDFTFIDDAAEAVVRLALYENAGIFHVQNTKNISMREIGVLLEQVGIKVKPMYYRNYLEFIFDNRSNPKYGSDIETILLHTHLEENVKLTRFMILCDKTEKALEECGFKWTAPNAGILSELIKCGVSRGFFESAKKEVVK